MNGSLRGRVIADDRTAVLGSHGDPVAFGLGPIDHVDDVDVFLAILGP